MTTYSTISDTEIDVNSPITTSLTTKYRNNLTAVLEGDSTSPGLQLNGLQIGGSGRDADPAAIPTNGGIHTLAGLTDNTGGSIASVTIIMVKGDVDLSGATITVPTADVANSETDRLLLDLCRGVRAENGELGQSSAGTGGTGLDSVPYIIRYPRPTIGGEGGGTVISGSGGGGAGYGDGGNGSGTSSGSAAGGSGGGSLVLLVEGDCDLSSCTITANGATGGTNSSAAGGGGGGGTIKVFCTGTLTLTSAVITANGGAGGNNTSDGGGGGGGIVYLAGVTVTGSGTLTANGGSGPGSATDGSAGLATSATLTIAQIRDIMHYW